MTFFFLISIHHRHKAALINWYGTADGGSVYLPSLLAIIFIVAIITIIFFSVFTRAPVCSSCRRRSSDKTLTVLTDSVRTCTVCKRARRTLTQRVCVLHGSPTHAAGVGVIMVMVTWWARASVPDVIFAGSYVISNEFAHVRTLTVWVTDEIKWRRRQFWSCCYYFFFLYVFFLLICNMLFCHPPLIDSELIICLENLFNFFFLC